MLCDFYELTMGNGYYRNGFYKRNVYFDVFFRNVPDGGGFAIAAGLEQIVEYIQQLHFSDDDIAYLRSKGIFDEGFLNYLKNFKFHGDIYAVPEGTPVFPGEPLLTVRAPAIEAQLIETYLLLEINHQSLIATKANRIVRAAQGRAVLEFVGEGCIGCKLCYSVCPQKCIDITKKPVAIDQHHCLHCGRCAETCPKQVIEKRV